ncbi:MAG: L,D-transpeptidase [Ahrensia sp.]|nr:L,D-transpeptidase [Ahrensia sp.]
MKKIILCAASLAACSMLVAPTHASERYATPPPIVLSPDLASPWVMQLKPGQISARPVAQRVIVTRKKEPLRTYRPQVQEQTVAALAPQKPQQRDIDPIYLPQEVNYNGGESAGTIVISTRDKFLYLVQSGGKAMRYGVGVGRQGFTWSGTERISQKREWPTWTPPAEMIAREKKKGIVLPARMEGGPENPLGARALYLGSTLYRIHGTNAPWTIGGNVSSGCIRMRNQDIEDLYTRVNVGTKVIVR